MRFTTRRTFCRTIFITVCLLPTIIVGALAAWRNSPLYRRRTEARWRQQLTETLGMELACSNMRLLADGTMVADQVCLSDPESHAWLVRMRSLVVVSTRTGLEVTVFQPEICIEHLNRLWGIVHERLLTRPPAARRTVRLEASTLALANGERTLSVEGLHFENVADAAGTQWLIQFRMAGSPAAEPYRLRIVRNRQIHPAETGWELHTGPTPLPCDLVAVGWSAAAQLGPDAAFCGSWWAEHQNRAWHHQFRGELTDVSLDHLVTQNFPHKLSGNARVTVREAELLGGRLSKISGDLQVPGGVISRSLLAAAEDALGLAPVRRADQGLLVRYGQLGLSFSLDRTGLRFTACGNRPNVILADQRGPLLVETDSMPLSAVRLIELLVPQSTVQVPATRETAALVRLLPLPEVMPPPAGTARQTHHPLRLIVE